MSKWLLKSIVVTAMVMLVLGAQSVSADRGVPSPGQGDGSGGVSPPTIIYCSHNGELFATVNDALPCPLHPHDSEFKVEGVIAVPRHEPGQHCYYSRSTTPADLGGPPV